MSGAPYENLQFGVGIEFAPGRRELIVSSVVAGCSAYVEGTVQVNLQTQIQLLSYAMNPFVQSSVSPFAGVVKLAVLKTDW
jgi:hypothetical protein